MSGLVAGQWSNEAEVEAVESGASEPAPYRRKMWFSHGLLGLAGGGLLGSVAAFGASPATFAGGVLVHAFEGALVGGLCDWFAVWKAYNAVEKNRDDLAEAIGSWVSGELVSHQVIKQHLDAMLDDPATHRTVYAWLDRKLGSLEDTRELLERAWRQVEPDVVAYVASVDLSEGELASARSAIADRIITATIQRCLGKALIEVSDDPRLEALVEALGSQAPIWMRPFLALFDVPSIVRGQGSRLHAGAASSAPGVDRLTDALVDLGKAGAGAYLGAWNDLSVDERRAAAEALLRHLRDRAIDQVARFLHGQRDAIRPLETLRRYTPARRLVDRVETILDEDLSGQIGRMVSEQLRALPAREFRQNLERQTRSMLETIRINGTILGLGLGGALGALLHLLG